MDGLIDKLSAAERKVLLALRELDGSEVDAVREAAGFGELVEVMNAASWLASKGLVTIGERIDRFITVGPGAATVIREGLPERRALTPLAQVGMMAVDDLAEAAQLDKEDTGVAMGWLKRRGWADIRRVDGRPVLELTPDGDAAVDSPTEDELLLERLNEAAPDGLPEAQLDDQVWPLLKQRKALVRVREDVHRTLTLTDAGHQVLDRGLEVREEVAQLTPQMLRTGRWREVDMRPYDVSAYAPSSSGGKPHPVREVLERVRRVFKQMGFTEISGDFVQSAFWNMDALFTPQDHPARDLQDTLYLEGEWTPDVPDELVDRVRHVHEDGGDTGSRGWGGEFSVEETRRLLLRTHTTSMTIQYLADNPEEPCKIFSLGRVFRREAIDYSHLAEFYQVEGIVMEPGASFAMLVGVMREFYQRLGFEDIRVRPGYFPYTEPSMEVEVLLGDKWLEMGGSGVFRPEVTAPLGVKDPVLAWGQGLERIAMILYGIDDIRQLYETDLDWLRKRPLK
ncbi:MAG: phenylalanine--tRNA ligase subunit alpha [Thermoplasmata archaeon]|nr:MAG: phenylalanine--tRNA ligase subunit alpha [Thermoplasmata archaeon]